MTDAALPKDEMSIFDLSFTQQISADRSDHLNIEVGISQSSSSTLFRIVPALLVLGFSDGDHSVIRGVSFDSDGWRSVSCAKFVT